jgi:hypothetical protein
MMNWDQVLDLLGWVVLGGLVLVTQSLARGLRNARVRVTEAEDAGLTVVRGLVERLCTLERGQGRESTFSDAWRTLINEHTSRFTRVDKKAKEFYDELSKRLTAAEEQGTTDMAAMETRTTAAEEQGVKDVNALAERISEAMATGRSNRIKLGQRITKLESTTGCTAKLNELSKLMDKERDRLSELYAWGEGQASRVTELEQHGKETRKLAMTCSMVKEHATTT